MSQRDQAEQYEAALKQLQPHISREPDGTFRLNVESGESLGIDPVVFADLKELHGGDEQVD